MVFSQWNYLTWSASCLNPNAIDKPWGIPARRFYVQGKPPIGNTVEFKNQTLKPADVQNETLNKLADSVPNRFNRNIAIKNKGKFTKR